MSVDVILGRVGTRLPSDTGVLLADADAASTIEQAAVFGPSAAFVRDCVRTNLHGSVEVQL